MYLYRVIYVLFIIDLFSYISIYISIQLLHGISVFVMLYILYIMVSFYSV